MVVLLRDARSKRGAKVRRCVGSCTIQQDVVKCRSKKIEGAERA